VFKDGYREKFCGGHICNEAQIAHREFGMGNGFPERCWERAFYE
jgi:hypothetical protein